MTLGSAAILVVDSEAGARTFLCGILEEAGYRVIGLEKEADAPAIMKKGHFDAVILNLETPDASELSVLETARKINPGVAIIITTACASAEVVVEAVNQKAYACLAKPVNPDEIKNTIANALRQRQLSLENNELVERLQRSSKRLFETNSKLQSDIAERKRIEEALRFAANQWRTTFDAIGDAVCLLDDEANVVRCNKAMTEMMGKPYSEINGRNCCELWHGRKEPVEGCPLVRMKETGCRATSEMSLDGKWFEIAVDPLADEAGNIIGAVHIIADITERRRWEEALRQSEEFSSTLLRNAPYPLLVLNADTSIKYVNPALEEQSGFTMAEVFGMKAPYPWWTEEAWEKTSRDFKVALKKGAVGKEELFQKKSGERFWVNINSTPVIIDGEYKYYLANWVNITERKRMEQELKEKSKLLEVKNKELQTQSRELMKQERKLVEKTRELEVANKAKSEFMAHMSHELRTPLNVVIGFSELMLDGAAGELGEEHIKCLKDILGSGQHLLSLINDILDLSKIEAGKMELAVRNIALQNILDTLKNELMPIINRRKQNLELVIEDGVPPVRADRDKIRQVLLNLLSNSIKFTSDGGHLRVEVSREDGWCRISVIDDGIGIKKKDQRTIFEPFSQVDSLMPKESGGTGLGLAISKQIIEKHGGRIWVDSKYGKGSQFHFTLPLAVPDNTS
jgi:PAS domain S-box-containing protein